MFGVEPFCRSPYGCTLSRRVDGVIAKDTNMLWMWLGCSMGFNGTNEEPEQTDKTLTESEVEVYITNEPIDLAGGSSVDGDGILTEASDVSWLQLSEVPEGFADGVDDDALTAATCPDGAWLAYEQATASWVCAVTVPVEGVSTDDGSEGQVLVIEDGKAQWVDLGTLLAETPCPSGMAKAGDVCVETTRRTESGREEAAVDCAEDGYQLCSAYQWALACEMEVITWPTDPFDNTSEWAATTEQGFFSTTGVQASGCWEGGLGSPYGESGTHAYRCCGHP
jgi:hypothetical protein